MNRINIIDLAEPLAIRHKLTREEAQDFLEQVFAVIRDGIDQEGLVKVRGLGTFKSTNVEARESVNVNTGERIIIDSHAKLSFTPDSAMREVVNKPFSLFDTVLLNEGVEFNDTDNDEGEENTPLIDAEPLAPTQDTDEKPAEQVVEEENHQDAETDDLEVAVTSQKDVPAPPQAELVEEVQIEEKDEDESELAAEGESTDQVENGVADEIEEGDLTDEEEEQEEETGNKSKWWWVVAAVMVVLAIFAAVYKDEIANVFSSQKNTELIKDSVFTADEDTTIVSPTDTLETAKASISSKASTVEKDTLPDYDALDNRIRTGAYRIVGMDYSIKAREGETVEHLANRTLGPGMECYIETYNNVRGPLSGGQVVKIPKLQLRKKLKQSKPVDNNKN